MHISEAFPRTYAALGEALESLGFRARDAFIVEMLIAELKQWAAAEEELSCMSPSVRKMLFRGDGSLEVVAPRYRDRFVDTCALAENLLGRYRDEPSDPRFLA